MNTNTNVVHDMAAIRIKNRKMYDAYSNAMSGFGGQYDPVNRLTYNTGTTLDRGTIETLYRQDWLSRKIVETIPDDCTRKWIDINIPNEKLIINLQNKIEELDLVVSIKEAMINARLYGGSILIIGIDDGMPPYKPIDYKKINDVLYFNVIDKNYVDVKSYYKDPFKMNYGKPELYRLQTLIRPDNYNENDYTVHESRIVRFDGNYLPEFTKRINKSWNDSVLNSINNSLKHYGTSIQSGAILFQDFINKVLKIPNLADLLQSDEGKQALELRLQYAIANFSSLGIVLVGEDEEYNKIQTPIAGLADLIDKYIEIISAASNIPRSRLFGQSLGTLAGATESTRAYYDSCVSYQTYHMNKHIRKIFKILLNSKSSMTRGREPREWGFKFNSLWDETNKEKTTARKMQAQVDQIYIEGKVLTPEEVTVSRFRADGYSFDTIVNVNKRLGEFFEQNSNTFNTNIDGEKFEPPASGDAPQSVKHILSSIYSHLRSIWVKEHPNDKENKHNKEMCARIAWNAVKEAGWYKDKNGEWNKK